MLEADARAIFQRLTAVEEHSKHMEALLTERENARMERLAERRRVDDQLLKQIAQLDMTVQDLAKKTRTHLMVQSCLNGGKHALQWGSMGGGVVATVVLIGKLLNFW